MAGSGVADADGGFVWGRGHTVALAVLCMAARNRAFGIWGAVTAGAATLGLVIGGVLVTAAGWRWVFLVNLPLGAAVITAAPAW